MGFKIPKIEKCPFCGSDRVAIQESFKNLKGESMYGINCYNCHPHAYHETKELAIKAWNKRILGEKDE